MIGASGFLGSRLLALAPRDVDLTGTGWRHPVRPGTWREARLDLASPSALRELMERERPEAILLCAYDKADRAITVDAACAAARHASRTGARFIFFSTDLVFDGRAGNYAEDAPVSPVMPYGALKAEAEAQVRVEHPMTLVIRHSLMVGESGPHQRPAYECGRLTAGQPVELYVDEWRSPLHVDDVARAAWELAVSEVGGTIHLAGARLSRLELGKLLCAIYGFDPALLRQAKRPADRPRDTSLDASRAAALLGWAPRPLAALARPPLAGAGA